MGMGVPTLHFVREREGLERLQTAEEEMKEGEMGREGSCSVLCLLFGSRGGGGRELKEETPRNEFLKTAEETQGARQEGNIGPWVTERAPHHPWERRTSYNVKQRGWESGGEGWRGFTDPASPKVEP